MALAHEQPPALETPSSAFQAVVLPGPGSNRMAEYAALGTGLILPGQVLAESPDHLITVHTERQGPDNVIDAQRKLHARAYTHPKHGILSTDAIDPKTGYVIDEIDHSTGPNVDYVAAWGVEDVLRQGKGAQMRSSYRLIGTSSGYEALPSVERTFDAGGVDDSARERLGSYGDKVVECAALSSELDAPHEATAEAYAAGINKSHRNGEIWVAGIVPKAFKNLTMSMGPENIEQVGVGVEIDHEHVNEAITLTPVIIDPELFVPRLLAHGDSLVAKGRTAADTLAPVVYKNAAIFGRNVMDLLDDETASRVEAIETQLRSVK